MKKVILVCLCVLFVVGTSAFGYSVSGLVMDGSSTVSGASVYINCYPAAGGVLSDTDTSGPLGGYSGGWPLTNCKGEKIVVKAVSGSKSGTVSWVAQYEAEVQNVTIYIALHPTAELHCEAEPMPMSEPYAVVPSTVQLYMQVSSGPILVNGGSATMQYDTQTMYCSGVEPNPPFTNFSYSIEPASGTINVYAHATPACMCRCKMENIQPHFLRSNWRLVISIPPVKSAMLNLRVPKLLPIPAQKALFRVEPSMSSASRMPGAIHTIGLPASKSGSMPYQTAASMQWSRKTGNTICSNGRFTKKKGRLSRFHFPSGQAARR